MTLSAVKIIEDLQVLSEDQNGVTRFPFTKEHEDAVSYLTALMQKAGMSVSMDAAGTLIGRTDGSGSNKTLLMGSHQDSVRNGGAYDGIMGVVLPVLAMAALKDKGVTLPFSVECLAFADEEGARFPTALIGPRALAGTFDPAVLDMRDVNGVSIREAMTGFGLVPDDIVTLKRDAEQVIGYVETHIEQGPLLEDENQALGVVSAICGIERHNIDIKGMAAHAGTCPMHLRVDALTCASVIIAEVERLAQNTEDLVATVGYLNVTPNVVNAVPGGASMTLEIRSPNDQIREDFARAIQSFAADLAAGRGAELSMERTYSQKAQQCDPMLSDGLFDAVKDAGGTGLKLASGATHDASAMADLTPIAMLFVRCKGGVSHNPAEFCSGDDMNVAISALASFLENLSVA